MNGLRDAFDKHYETLKSMLSEVPAEHVKTITDLMYTCYLFGREDTVLYSDLTSITDCDIIG